MKVVFPTVYPTHGGQIFFGNGRITIAVVWFILFQSIGSLQAYQMAILDGGKGIVLIGIYMEQS